MVVETAPGRDITAGTFGSGASRHLTLSLHLHLRLRSGDSDDAGRDHGHRGPEKPGAAGLQQRRIRGASRRLVRSPQQHRHPERRPRADKLEGLRAVYDQLLPPQGQGLFDALDHAAESVSSLAASSPTPAPASPAQACGSRRSMSGCAEPGSKPRVPTRSSLASSAVTSERARAGRLRTDVGLLQCRRSRRRSGNGGERRRQLRRGGRVLSPRHRWSDARRPGAAVMAGSPRSVGS